MKKIPAQYVLTEEDIKEAITEWLNENHKDSDEEWGNFKITFSQERQDRLAPKGAPVGGMSDYSVTVITAVATEDR